MAISSCLASTEEGFYDGSISTLEIWIRRYGACMAFSGVGMESGMRDCF